MKHGRGYVYDLYYHIVWCVKYRREILVDNIKRYIQNQGDEDAKRNENKIVSE